MQLSLSNVTLKLLNKHLNIKILTDSEKLFNVIIRNAPTTERRIIIEEKAAGEAYKDGIIDDVIWIRRKYDLANFVTKATILPQLVEMMETRKRTYEIEQSVKISIEKIPDTKPLDENYDEL